MSYEGVYAAISADIRAGDCSQRAIESFQAACEQGVLSAEEREYLADILAEAN